jgi:Family of unknown function (DUF6262)
MARADNSSFLAQANARRHQAALLAARHAIQELQRQGQPVNFSTVAQSAGVSRGWLYRQDQLRDLIGRQQALKPPAARRATAQRATRNGRLAPPAARRRPRREHPPASREPLPPRPARLPSRPPADPARRAPQPRRDDHGHDPPHGCGKDMSTPQKCLPTRHYPQATSDNRRSERAHLRSMGLRLGRRSGCSEPVRVRQSSQRAGQPIVRSRRAGPS